MKSGWKTKPLGEVCQVIGGGTPSKEKAVYYLGDIPWATVRDMQSDVISETECRITSEAVKNSSTNIIPSGNVVIATRVGLGKISIVGQDTAINQDLRGIIPNSPRTLSVRFLFWWFKSVSHLIVAEGTGATVQGIKLPFVKALQIPLPSLSEQQRIVAILDEAFAHIATARANAEENIKNARALFESQLQSIFAQRGIKWKQKTLEEVAITFGRGKSKHRPRNAPHLYGGQYPFIQTGDIRNADHIVTKYSQTYSEAGLAQSKLWPKGTICITIAANIAETAILGFDACFPDSVIGIVANPKEADIGFIEYLLQSFKVRIQAMGKGSAQANINLGTFEDERFPFPSIIEQKQIVAKLDLLNKETQRLSDINERKIVALEALEKSLLHQMFSGELAKKPQQAIIIPFPARIPNITTTDLHAGILAISYDLHERNNLQKHLGHVKAEKIAHMVEAHIGVDLERNPIKDAAGPNDYLRFKRKIEPRAKKAGYFEFKGSEKTGYKFHKYRQFDSLVSKTRGALGNLNKAVDDLIGLMLPMNTQQAEIFATVYAAWNNLLLDEKQPTDAEIVLEARENWHQAKLKIPRDKFFAAIGWLKEKGVVPSGKGKKVSAKSQK